jgi:hypothetical protein
VLGPLVNGLEVYAVSDPVLPRTDAGDGNGLDLANSFILSFQYWINVFITLCFGFLNAALAIETIKTHWNLSSWTGDPCLSIPFDWTSCSVDGTPRVTKL